MQLSSVTLEAKDVPSTVSYLSELLELEIFPLENEETLIKNQEIEFKVVAGSKSKSKGNIVFDMSVRNSQELDELALKAEFLQYRFGLNCTYKKIIESDSFNKLEILDPDGRRWRFNSIQ